MSAPAAADEMETLKTLAAELQADKEFYLNLDNSADDSSSALAAENDAAEIGFQVPKATLKKWHDTLWQFLNHYDKPFLGQDPNVVVSVVRVELK